MSLVSFNTAWAIMCENSSEHRDLDYSTGQMTFFSFCDSIEAGSHEYYGGIKYISFPDGLTEIGARAFNGDSTVESVDLSNTSVNVIGDAAFNGFANNSTITVKKGSKAHEILGINGLNSVTGDPINPNIGNNSTLIVLEPPTPTPTPLPTVTPQIGKISDSKGNRVFPLPEDEFGSYDIDPVTGEKNYLLFHTYAICMNFLNNDSLCSGYERCYHK